MLKIVKMVLHGQWRSKPSLFVLFCFLLFSCDNGNSGDSTLTEGDKDIVKPKSTPIKRAAFNADSAYFFIEKQVGFGPRVPGTESHAQCADYLEKTLSTYGFNTTVQRGQVTTYDNQKLNIKNIIGSFRPGLDKRILLFAHWDTRPFADRDTKRTGQPIDGANDGGSGVGVLLEIARQLNIQQPNLGVDIIFFDAEDYGQPENSMVKPKPDTWCLGSQYWSKNMHQPGYSAKYGILLDMVGAKDAIFPYEGTSMYYAPAIMKDIWHIANKLGYSNYFVTNTTNPTTDDHLYVNKETGIPSVCIVHYNPSTRDYGSFHHKHSDNMDIISKKTLRAVGETVLTVLLREADPKKEA